MTENILTVTREYKVADGRVMVKTKKPFVHVVLKSNGIFLEPVETISDDGFYLNLIYRNGYVYLPECILRAYAMNSEEIAYMLEDDTLFIKKSRRKKIDMPYIAEKPNDDFDFKRKMRKSKRMTSGFSVSLTEEEFKDLGSDLKIEACMGDKMFIHLSKATDEDIATLPTLKELQNYYGSKLNQYPYNHLSYVLRKGCSLSCIHFSNVIAKKWNIKTNEHRLVVYKQTDGSLVFIPDIGKCAMDDKPLNPAKEKVEVKEVCEHCYDPQENPDELKTMVLMLKQIHEACDKIDAKNVKLQEENEKLQKKLNAMEGIFKAMSDYVNNKEQ